MGRARPERRTVVKPLVVHDAPPMSSHETESDRKEDYAAHFEQDVLDAAEYLGWEMVQRIVDQAREEQ